MNESMFCFYDKYQEFFKRVCEFFENTLSLSPKYILVCKYYPMTKQSCKVIAEFLSGIKFKIKKTIK